MKDIIDIIIVDDHRLFRMGLRNTFKLACSDIHVTAEADSGEILFSLPELATAHLVLLDINLPGMGGVAIASRLRRDYPDLKILAISAENDSDTIQAMIESGIDGFVSKQRGDADELADAIRTVVNGGEYFGRDIASIIYDVYVAKKKTSAITSDFTGREREIMLLCREGLMCKEIADRLGVSIHTINTHKRNIYQKLGINNTMEMVQYAMKKGIIRVES